MLSCTKIIATLGPATDDHNVLQAILDEGVRLFRFNFSHGTHQDQLKRLKQLQNLANDNHYLVSVIGDLQGPKIRIGAFKDGPIWLESGDSFCINADCDLDHGTAHQVGTTYTQLANETSVGQTILLDDGRLSLSVNQIDHRAVHCTVLEGGQLSSNKGMNVLGGGLQAASTTEKDKEDLAFMLVHRFDYIALSFVKSAQDIQDLRCEFTDYHPHVIAKIECRQALDHLDEIIDAANAIMIARGDLGVEIGLHHIPLIQKESIERARNYQKPVITATQMMESMIHSPIPTRAEISDVANAILDGSDAVMLSAETASGTYAAQTVQAMRRTCLAVEGQPHRERTIPILKPHQAIASAAIHIANSVALKAIISITESGFTPLWMSRTYSNIPIFALSPNQQTLGWVNLYRNVCPIHFSLKFEGLSLDESAIDLLVKLGYLEHNDTVILTRGDQIGVEGITNTIRILTI